MSDIITLTGIVATIPRALTTGEGLAITSFRLASTQRKFDRASERWVDGETNWYTITTFRQLATNSAVSVKKGERVVVTGRLRIRDWQNGDKTGTNIEVDAEALGHDLAWGTAAFSRSVGSAPVETIVAQFPSDPDAPSEQSEADASQLVAAAAGSATDIETPF
jgi:single-strand DNA-binding protein